MKSSVTIGSRSALGTLLALLLIAAFLLWAGMFLFPDESTRQSFYSTFNILFAPGKPARTFTESLLLQFKSLDRPTLISGYAVLVFASAFSVGIFGCFLRGYRFRFLPHLQILERREMWLVMPVWVMAWIILGLPFVLAMRGRTWQLEISWVTALALAGPPLILLAAYTFAPDLMARAWFIRRWRRAVPLWVVAWMVLLAALWAVGWMVAKITGLWIMVKAGVPTGVAMAVLLPPAALIICWSVAPEILGIILYIPGWRTKVPFERIKRLEVQTSGEGGTGGLGGTVLTVTLKNEATWTLNRGSPKRLQRLGGTLSKVVGLERRDFVTWT